MEFILPALPQLFLFACGGLVLGLLALRTGNLIAPITAHASMNALTGILVLVLV